MTVVVRVLTGSWESELVSESEWVRSPEHMAWSSSLGTVTSSLAKLFWAFAFTFGPIESELASYRSRFSLSLSLAHARTNLLGLSLKRARWCVLALVLVRARSLTYNTFTDREPDQGTPDILHDSWSKNPKIETKTTKIKSIVPSFSCSCEDPSILVLVFVSAVHVEVFLLPPCHPVAAEHKGVIVKLTGSWFPEINGNKINKCWTPINAKVEFVMRYVHCAIEGR